MNDFQQALLEANFLFNLIASHTMELRQLGPQINNIGSEKYARHKKLTHDIKILKGLYAVNHRYILEHYEKVDDIKFETL